MTRPKPYAEYRNGGAPWLAAVPTHWHTAQIRRLATISNGADYKEVEVAAGGYPVFGSGGVFRRASAWLYEGESVLFGRKGTIDRPLHVNGRFWTVDTMFYTRLRSSVHGRFLYWYATTMPFSYYSTSTALPSMTQGDLAGHPMPLPPLDEQRAIADYLDREIAHIDALIGKQERLTETLRERRVAVISKAVTKGLDPAAPTIETGADWLGAIPEHWDATRLKNAIGSTQTGVWGDEPKGDQTDVLCVRVADFDRPRLRVSGDVPTVRSVRPSDAAPRLLRAGDLLLEKSGGTGLNPVGFVAIFDGASGPAVSSNFVTRVRLRTGQAPRYWLYSFAASYSTKLTARSVKQTTGIQNLDQASLFDEVFPFPPLDEQLSIAAYLDEQTAKIDALIAKAERFIEVSKERRSALITAAVTGQIDVRDAVGAPGARSLASSTRFEQEVQRV